LDNVNPLLTTIDVLVIPSNGEACGLAAMEGLICGTPVIAFNCIGLREVLFKTPANLVVTGNVKQLTDCIVNTQKSYNKIKSMSLSYVEEAKKRFDSHKTAAKLEKVIIDMVSS
jgi:glycosyltransferase involved in cell wall biosynthesis